MARALKTFYCRGALGTRVNPDTIGCAWTGEFDLNTLRVDREIFESERKSCELKNIRIRVDGALDNKWWHTMLYSDWGECCAHRSEYFSITFYTLIS